jgi:hypothetical protein
MWIYYQSAGNYGVYNSGSSGDAGTNGATRYIAVGQGFMVKALSSGNLSMANEIRIAQNPSFLKGISNESNIFSMQVTNTVNNFSDEIRIEFGHATGDGGAEKMFSFEIKSPGMFIPKGSNKYSIDFRGEPQSVSIPVSFIPGTDGQHVITADVTSFPLGTTIYLEDLQENRNQDLTANSSYSFDALKGDNENRFILHFGGTFDINEHSELPDYTVYSVDKSVMIIGKPGKKANGQVTVYNLIGQIVGHSVFSGDQTLRMNLNVPSGHYLVNIISSEKTQTSKVFIR